MMYPKPEPRKKKVPSKIKPMSQKRAKIQREMEKTYQEIDEQADGPCSSCNFNQVIDHSHLIPKWRDSAKIAEKKNIRRHCRDCHHAWESGMIWLLGDGEEIMNWLKTIDKEYYYTKLYQMQDRAIELDCFDELPSWAKNLE